MTLQMVVYTEIVYAVTIIILEIPTGIIADRWNRKSMLIIGALFACIELAIIIFAHTFWHFAIAVFFAGVSTSLTSGSENAILYDSLKHHKKQESFEKVLGRLIAFDFTASIIACLAGSIIASKHNYVLNYWMSLISVSAALLCVLFLKETKLHTRKEKQSGFFDYIISAFKFLRHDKNTFIIILSGMIIAACVVYVDEFWQIYLDNLAIPIIFFGIFASLTSVARVPGSIFAFKLKSRMQYRTVFITLFFIIIASLLVMAFIKGIAGIIAIIVICICGGVVEPLSSGYLHKRISSGMRATLDSFQSLIQRIAAIIIGLGFGWITAKSSIFNAYGFISILCFVYLIYFLMATKNKQL